MNKVSIALLVVLIPLLILLGSARFWIFDTDFYRGQYADGAYKTLGTNYSKQEIDLVTDQLLLYLRGGSPFPDSFFTSEEKSHMTDVKTLVSKGSGLLGVCLLLSLILLGTIIVYCVTTQQKVWFSYVLKHLGVVLTFGAVLTLVLGGFAFIGFENFSQTFTGFHLVFFPQGNWEFPAGSHLILLFPEDFFLAIAERIVMTAVAVAIICLLAGILLSRYGPLWEKQNN